MALTDFERIVQQMHNPRASELWRALQPLRSCLSFMNTGAHPDDESSAMLAALGLKEGVKLSHACATRGEGGQNALGMEAAKDLGVVRTREMERAAKILNMNQYWLSTSPEDSIFDFGFSKSGEETLGNWGKQRTLKRFVQILRTERPDIVCVTFLDVEGQHGHHRAMTQSAFEAVRLAADPRAFPETGLDVWVVKKLYLPAWSGAGDSYDDGAPPPPETTAIDGSGADPVLGADYAQIGQWSRSFHATQGMGVWVEPGQSHIFPLHLAWAAAGDPKKERNIFEGLPRHLGELGAFAGAPELGDPLGRAQESLDAAIGAWPDKLSIRRHAGTALGLIRVISENCPDAAKAEVVHRLEAKERQLSQVLMLASDIECRVSLSQSEAQPGEEIAASLYPYAPGLDVEAQLVAPGGWRVGEQQDGTVLITLPEDEETSNPYPDTWLPDRANGSIFARLNWVDEASGQALKIGVEVDGEEPIAVLPAHSATLSIGGALVNLSSPGAVEFTVQGIHPRGAKPALGGAEGWNIKSDNHKFSLSPKPGLNPGLYEFGLKLDDHPAQTIKRMKYRHTGPLVRSEPAKLRIRALDVALPETKIAYIGGGAERVDHWLGALGMDVTSLDDKALEQADFSGFDSILVGVFAFRTRPALSDRLKSLHDWVRAGGNLVTLYHRPWDNWGANTTPLAPLTIGKPSLRWRVTDENAKVTCLDPAHPLLNTPNRISPEDWQGWQKERGLYFASDWDKTYTPLLAMADPGEEMLTGSLLSGRFGAGRHTHTSLILHHQMECLVPGAFRVMANLLNPA